MRTSCLWRPSAIEMAAKHSRRRLRAYRQAAWPVGEHQPGDPRFQRVVIDALAFLPRHARIAHAIGAPVAAPRANISALSDAEWSTHPPLGEDDGEPGRPGGRSALQ